MPPKKAKAAGGKAKVRVLLKPKFRPSAGSPCGETQWVRAARQWFNPPVWCPLPYLPPQDGGGGGGDGGEDLSGQLLELEERIAQLEKEKQKEEEVRNYMQLERVS